MFFKTLLNTFLIPLYLYSQPVLEVNTLSEKVDDSAKRLSLDIASSVTWALKHHREVPIWELKLKMLRAKQQDAGLLGNPIGKFAYRGDSILGGDGRQEMSIGVQQSIPVTKRLKMEKEISELSLSILEEEYREWQRTMVQKVEEAFVELQHQYDKCMLGKEMIEHHHELTDFLEEKSKAGEIDVHEALQSQLELDFMEQAQANAEALKETFERKLKLLLGLDDDQKTNFDFSSNPEVSTSDSIDEDLESHPQIILQNILLQKAELELGLEKAKRWNDLMLGLEWERERELDAFGQVEKVDSLGLELGVPLPFKKVNRGAIRSSEINVERAKVELKMLRLNLRQKIARLKQEQFDLEQLSLQMGKGVIQQVDEHIKLYTEAYKSGQVSLDRLMRSYDKLLEAKGQQLELKYKNNLVKVELRAISSQNLSKVNLEQTP